MRTGKNLTGIIARLSEIIFCLIVIYPAGQSSADTATKSDPETGSRPMSKLSQFKDPGADMEMVFVKGGCFQMGDTFGDGDRDEKPVHDVCVNDFYMGKFEVTQGQWQAIMGTNPSNFKNCGDNCPVEEVSWNDSQEFIKRLNEKITPLSPPLAKGGDSPSFPLSKGGQRGLYRLPTEAEWEYAARSGGRKEKWAGTNNESELGNFAFYFKNSANKTHPVGQKKPNGLGLYDMSGNVWEWVQDRYDKDYYNNSQQSNPTGPNSGQNRVLRGGSWDLDAAGARTTLRDGSSPDLINSVNGFRLARTR